MSLHIEIDPILQTTDPLIRDLAITAYAARVRRGYYGHGHQMKVQGVTDALSAISKTLELGGYTSPLYRAPNTYTLLIQRCVEGFRREDPPAMPRLALPLQKMEEWVKPYRMKQRKTSQMDQSRLWREESTTYFQMKATRTPSFRTTSPKMDPGIQYRLRKCKIASDEASTSWIYTKME